MVKDIKKGEVFTVDNVKSIRPAFGIETKYIRDIIGKKSVVNIKTGTPMDWKYVQYI